MAADFLTTSGVTRAVAARGLSAPEQTVRNLANRGVIKAQRDSEGRRVFTPDTVDTVCAYLRKRRRRQA
jgi:hypothetical protein